MDDFGNSLFWYLGNSIMRKMVYFYYGVPLGDNEVVTIAENPY